HRRGVEQGSRGRRKGVDLLLDDRAHDRWNRRAGIPGPASGELRRPLGGGGELFEVERIAAALTEDRLPDRRGELVSDQLAGLRLGQRGEIEPASKPVALRLLERGEEPRLGLRGARRAQQEHAALRSAV